MKATDVAKIPEGSVVLFKHGHRYGIEVPCVLESAPFKKPVRPRNYGATQARSFVTVRWIREHDNYRLGDTAEIEVKHLCSVIGLPDRDVVEWCRALGALQAAARETAEKVAKAEKRQAKEQIQAHVDWLRDYGLQVRYRGYRFSDIKDDGYDADVLVVDGGAVTIPFDVLLALVEGAPGE